MGDCPLETWVSGSAMSQCFSMEPAEWASERRSISTSSSEVEMTGRSWQHEDPTEVQKEISNNGSRNSRAFLREGF